MRARIEKSIACGEAKVNPSKSYLHRYLIGAALSQGESVIENVSFSEDIKATLDCIETLGAEVTVMEEKNQIKVKGTDLINKDLSFSCRESGSTLRFFIPISLTKPGKRRFYGSLRLLSRPLNVYEEIFKEQGIIFENKKEYLDIEGCLNPGNYKVLGNVSSQFITGLLFSLPLLTEDSVIEIVPPVESKSYIDITIKVLSDFGIKIENDDYKYLKIKGNQCFTPGKFKVEGDASNAAFLDSFNYLGGSVKVRNLYSALETYGLQGDRVYMHFFRMICEDSCEDLSIDISDCPDLGPILFTMAAIKRTVTFFGTKRLAIKESDRVSAVCEELSKVGVKAEISENSCKIIKGDIHKSDVPFDSHNDHRIVMSMAVLSSVLGGEIENAEAVNKSFPEFFKIIKELGVKVELYE
jgi:3-phosphoshikimate 1-carboxyvinyltransferase